MTYSIVARDPETGDLGVAVQTHQPAVGAAVPWVKGGVGAIATQANTNIAFGPDGLALLEQGRRAAETLAELLANDVAPAIRQVAIIAASGPPVVHTGARCTTYAGHQVGEHYSVQANIMLNDTVPAAMARAFEGAGGHLAERMLGALEAAQAEGGDMRGMQSAAILVRGPSTFDPTWDLRVDNDPHPLARLADLVNIRRVGVLLRTPGPGQPVLELPVLLANLAAARPLVPSDEQFFWFAARGLAAAPGGMEHAVALLQPLFEREPRWLDLLRRMDGMAELKAQFPA
jgi:uncharacterized Ntn-hydrolase superfamily protein